MNVLWHQVPDDWYQVVYHVTQEEVHTLFLAARVFKTKRRLGHKHDVSEIDT